MSLPKAQMHAMIASDPHFARLVTIHGEPAAVKDCTVDGQPGDICMAGNCVNGRRLVLRCDDSNGCAVYDTIPC